MSSAPFPTVDDFHPSAKTSRLILEWPHERTAEANERQHDKPGTSNQSHRVLFGKLRHVAKPRRSRRVQIGELIAVEPDGAGVDEQLADPAEPEISQ